MASVVSPKACSSVLEDSKSPHTSTQNPNAEFFDKIITHVNLDFRSQEIQDSQSGVHKMLERVVDRVNQRGIFRVARIEPVGGMAEKTALWKYDDCMEESLNTYMEFDFLAVLEIMIDDYKRKSEHREHDFCRWCELLVKIPLQFDKLNDDKATESDMLRDKKKFTNLFRKEINRCLASSCDCLSFVNDSDDTINFKSASSENSHGCQMCTIDMPTGTLSVYTSPMIPYFTNCSMVFLWKSKANSLLAPDCRDWKLPYDPKPISSFLIHVDFLPALESLRTVGSDNGSEHDYFLVPKDCNAGGDFWHGWRKSWCLAELNNLTEYSSANHIKCYQIMKYIFSSEGRKYNFNNYHVKNIALRHNTRCTDTSKDIVTCVNEMMEELLRAYESASLEHFHHQSLNLLSNKGIPDWNVNRVRTMDVIKKLS